MLHKTGFVGAYILITFTFACQHDQLVEVCSDRLKRWVLETGTTSRLVKQGFRYNIIGIGEAPIPVKTGTLIIGKPLG